MRIPSILISVPAAWFATWLLFRLVSRESGRHRAQTLIYGRTMRAFSLALTLFAGFVVFAASKARPSQRGIAATVAFLFVACAVYFLLEVFGTHIAYDARGIRARSPWRRQREIPWSDICGYHFSSAGVHVLHTATHGYLRLSTLLMGIEDFESTLAKALEEASSA